MTTTDTMTGSQQAHAALLLRHDEGGSTGDRALLAELRAEPDVVVIDHGADLRAELAALRPAVTEAALGEPLRWAWYPWRRTLVSVLGPLSFRRVRLDRNRNKITSTEQDGYRRLTIGIVGLSVGHSIAHTLALEGLCGRLRLADNDRLELSNLNRIPASVFDIGINKAVVVARRIAELDPYVAVDTFTSGVTEQNISEFLAGLDLVIEECDSLDMKVRIRQSARARGIPVLMDTSDRGLFDVERFDAEPERALFHGLLGDTDPVSLRGLSTRAKAPHVMRILQTAELSARMAASVVEIDRTVTTWPQLGGDVQLGAATVAAAVRRFGRGEPLPSGRIRIDLDSALDTLSAATGQPAAVSSPVGVDLTVRVPAAPVDAVLQAMAMAPSGGNSQPWALSVVPGGVQARVVQARTSAMDVAFRGSYVGIGAAAFNAQVAAAQHGLRASIAAFPDEQDPGLAASIALTRGSDPELAKLYPAMVQRITNRNPGRRRELAPDVVTDLHRAAAAGGATMHLVTDPAGVAEMADILAASDRIRFLTPRLHQQMMAELNWFEHAALGIDVRSLGLDAADLAKLAVASRADVMACLASWHGGAALGDSTRDRVNASSAVAVLTVPGDTPADYLRGGMAVEQVWIRAGQHRLDVQPVSPVFLYARSDTDLKTVSEEFTADLHELQRLFRSTIGLDGSQTPVLVLRLSHDAPPAVRGRRLDRSAVMSGTDGSSNGWGQSW
jgi:hypothetical protein